MHDALSRPVSTNGPKDVPGIYGFGLELEETDAALADWLQSALPAWPLLRLRRTVESALSIWADRSSSVSDAARTDATRVALPGGVAVMRRDSHEVWFRTISPLPLDELVHPLLGHAALAFSHWLGREVFHAGVFLAEGGAWALLGERGSGKSSTLAWLARNGCPIVADDLLVLDGRTAFAGPRTLDLAHASVAHLVPDERTEHVRGGFRRRLALNAVAAEHTLEGWIELRWDELVGIAPVPGPERIALLVEHGHQPDREVDWSNVLELATLPTFQLHRPKRLDSLEQAGELLLATIRAAV